MKSAWVRPFSAQDSIRAWVDLNTYIFCAGGTGEKKKINAISGWISGCVSQGHYLAHLLSSRHCRIALLHSLCISLRENSITLFLQLLLLLWFYDSLSGPFFAFLTSFLQSVGCHELCLLMPWFLPLQGSKWTMQMNYFPKHWSCSILFLAPEK